MHKIFYLPSTFGIYRKFYENFVSNADNETFCTVQLTSQVVLVQCLQPKGPKFESTFFFFFFFGGGGGGGGGGICTSLFDSFNFIILDVPRPLSNVFWTIIFKRLMRNAYTEPSCLEHLCVSK